MSATRPTLSDGTPIDRVRDPAAMAHHLSEVLLMLEAQHAHLQRQIGRVRADLAACQAITRTRPPASPPSASCQASV